MAPDGLHALRLDVAAFEILADHHAGEPLLEVLQRGREAERRHGLGRDRQVEAVLAHGAVAAEAHHDVAQRAIVDVESAAPGDTRRVEPERVAPVDVVVDHRRQEVVGRRQRVEVAREVEVDLVLRDHLGPAAAVGAALHPETRPQRGLAQADDRPAAGEVQRVAEADRRRGLAFAGRRRADGGDEDQAAAPPGQRRHGVEGDLGLVGPVAVERLGGEAGAGTDLDDGLQHRGAGDVGVGRHAQALAGAGRIASRPRTGPKGSLSRRWIIRTGLSRSRRDRSRRGATRPPPPL